MGPKIAIADAQPCVREGLKAVLALQNGMQVVAEAENGPQALQFFAEAKPDVIIVDPLLPGSESADLVLSLKQKFSAVSIILFTSLHDAMSVRSGIAAGATGYVLKSSSAAMILHAVRTTLEGGIFLDPKVASHFTSLSNHGSYVSDLRPSAAHQPESRADISQRERDVLKYTALGLTGKEIAYSLGISIKTVETYRARAKAKLDLHNRADIVHYGAMNGWFEA